MSGRVVTFYSYKGGVGRSFLLANVAALLAQWGHRVLCIDWDLEAPGLRHYFSDWTDGVARPGVVDLVLDVQSGERALSWGRTLTPVAIPAAQGALHLISAGQSDGQYHRQMQSIRWDLAYERGLGTELEQLRAEWKARYDLILVDSRTGVSDIAGICTMQLPDQLVYLFTANSQSIQGANETLRTIVSSRQKLPLDREQLLALPILSRFAQDKEYDLAAKWMEAALAGSRDSYAPWLSRGVEPEAMMRATRIPEIAYWTFGERLPVIIESASNSDPQSINYPIGNIAALVARGFADTDQLLLSRESYLAGATNTQRAAKRIGVAADAVPVYVSSSDEPESLRFRAALEAAAPSLGIHVVEASAGADVSAERLKLFSIVKFLIVLVTDRMSPHQTSEVESFFSVSFRSQGAGGILPIALSPHSIANAPSLLRSFNFLEAQDGMTTEVEASLHRVLGTPSPSEVTGSRNSA
jgi:MinD-like ATPase involved in chromosome partitioning or flagellar assembly